MERSKLVSSLSLLVALCMTLGSCLDSGGITPYQQLQEDIAKIDSYLAKNPPDLNDIIVRDASSGIRLVITEQGTGAIPPTPENIIQVAYTGRLLSNGAQFDSDDLFTFTLTTEDAGSDVIAGWKYALAMMTEGTHATVYIPSGYAYGPNGQGAIPKNAILVFDLELKVVNTDNEEPRLTNDIAAISFYVEEKAIENVQIDPSGLHYVIQDIGSGNAPGLYDHVRIRYTGKIMNVNETVFADNIEQGPVNIFSSRVVNYNHGLIIGLQKMNEGGKATFYLPSALGYGPSVNGVIPANSNLIFEVELLEVIPNQQ
jgi:FKBP-type peptidyl-prolyl cis-trans isomerase